VIVAVAGRPTGAVTARVAATERVKLLGFRSTTATGDHPKGNDATKPCEPRWVRTNVWLLAKAKGGITRLTSPKLFCAVPPAKAEIALPLPSNGVSRASNGLVR